MKSISVSVIKSVKNFARQLSNYGTQIYFVIYEYNDFQFDDHRPLEDTSSPFSVPFIFFFLGWQSVGRTQISWKLKHDSGTVLLQRH